GHTSVDANLLRDRWEWDAVERCVEEAEAGALVLVDGDLVPDWRIPSMFVAELLERAAARGVLVAGVTKHSSLARGGAPLVDQLAACPPWLRQELWLELEELFHRAGVPPGVTERAFADRHRLMERS